MRRVRQRKVEKLRCQKYPGYMYESPIQGAFERCLECTLAGLELRVEIRKRSQGRLVDLAWVMGNLLMVPGEKTQTVSQTFSICWIIIPEPLLFHVSVPWCVPVPLVQTGSAS